MTDDASLERRLSTLFATADLGVMARPDAARLLVTQVARRRRRRRFTRAAAAVLGGTLSVSLIAGTVAHRPWLETRPEKTSLPAASPAELTLRQGTVGPLRLGMTLAEVTGTGLIGDQSPYEQPDQPGCSYLSGRHGITRIIVGPRGVEYVAVYPFISTAEGVAIGDRIAAARRAYPALRVPDDWQLGTVVSVPVPDAPGAHYEITIDVKGDVAGSDPDDALVSRLALVSDTAACHRS